jgi:hypothetical protein
MFNETKDFERIFWRLSNAFASVQAEPSIEHIVCSALVRHT